MWLQQTWGPLYGDIPGKRDVARNLIIMMVSMEV